MTQPPVLALEDVTLAPGGRTLLRNVTLSLPAGSVTVLRGCNGAGKTSLLRMVMGLVPPFSGAVHLLGDRPEAARNRIGYLPQSRVLPAPRFTGRAIVAAAWQGARLGLPGFGARSRTAVNRALDLADARTIADRAMAHLSGGERQRIGLAAALVNAPEFLILDEPLAGLDPQRQGALATLLTRLHRETAMPLLISVHGASPLDHLATDELLIENGGARVYTAPQRHTVH